MLKFTIKSTDEYERLVKFFVENQLEFDGDEEVDTDILKCWKVTHRRLRPGSQRREIYN